MKMPRIMNDINELQNEYKEAVASPDTFYKAELLKRNGAVIDKDGAKKTISDVIVSFMENDNPLLKVKQITNKLPYIINHSGKRAASTRNSNRLEELTAMALFNRTIYEGSDIDYVVDYQVPIERTKEKTSGIGKIDLIAVSHTKRKIYLMELKRHSNVQESLLRCAAECYTYYMQIDKLLLAKQVANCEKLKADMEKCNDPANISAIEYYEIIPAVLVFENQRQHMQYESKHFENVQGLMKSLNISMFIIKAPQGYRDKDYDKLIQKCTVLDITK